MSSVAAQTIFAPSTMVGRSVVLPATCRLDLSLTNVGIVLPLAAGLVTVHHVVGGQFEIPQQITFTWVTSSTVANRTLGVKLLDQDSNVVGQVLMNGVQAASTSYRYTFMLDAGQSFVSGIFGIAPLPYMVMQPGWQWQIIGTNLDSGDQQNGLTHTEIVVPTGPQLTPASVATTPPPVLI